MKKQNHFNNNESAFLGLFEGKRKRAKAEAEIKIIEAKAASDKALLAAKVAADQVGYKTPEQKAVEASVQTATIESQSNTLLYVIIGVVVVVVMAGLYFIKRR
jgi:cobalamin biosynthesis Mg chelatase CobN